MIKIESLDYKYQDGKLALKDISMDLNKGRVIGLIGANGSGKSTLFLNILGILTPHRGSIKYKGKNLEYSKKFMRTYRKDVNLVFQDPEKQIFYSNIEDDIAFSLRNLNYPEEDIKERVDQVLSKIKARELRDRPVHFLSYGQKKRVAIAGVLVMDSKLMLLDEPTAGLDPRMTREMKGIIRDLSKDRKLLISSHDMDFIYEVCDYIYILKDGEIIGEDRTEDIFLESDILTQALLEKPWLVKVHEKLGIPLYRSEEEFLEKEGGI